MIYKMKDYRRLTAREKKKISFYKKSRKNLKWWAVFSGIVVLFLCGLVAFYMFIDSKSESSGITTASTGNNSPLQDTDGLDELSRKELERESEKNKKIDTSKNDNEGAEPQSSPEKPYDFSEWNKSCAAEMIVINKDNPVPDGMKFTTKLCRGKEVAALASEDLEKMVLAAQKEKVTLWISSGYRDTNLQTKLFNRQVEAEKSRAKEVISTEEAEERASRVVARPGRSEHNTGFAVDFNGVTDNFYTTSEYKWLMDNAHKYGFIERYQKKWSDYTGVTFEPWHFRYVGAENAAKIKESGLCLEEYVIKNLIKINKSKA